MEIQVGKIATTITIESTLLLLWLLLLEVMMERMAMVGGGRVSTIMDSGRLIIEFVEMKMVQVVMRVRQRLE